MDPKMEYSIFNTVRSCINKIHQYDESTSLRGEVLDGDLKETGQTCKAHKEKLSELRKQRNEAETALEDASLKKQIAKRSLCQKGPFTSCLEAEAKRLDAQLTQQEGETQRYFDATKEGKISELIESFKGIQLEKETKFDEVRFACDNKRKLIAQMEADIQEEGLLNESKLKVMKENLTSKETCFATASNINRKNQIKLKELSSSNANTSGELQFLEEKRSEHHEKVIQIKSSLKVGQDKKDQLLIERKEQEDRHTISLERYKGMEATFEEKMYESRKIVDDIQNLKITLDALKQAKHELGIKKNELTEISNTAMELEKKVQMLQNVEEDKIRISQETQNMKSERDEEENLLNISLEKLHYLAKVKEEVVNDQEKLSVLTKDWKDLLLENNNLSSESENLDIKIERSNASISSLNNAVLDSAMVIANKDTEISDKQLDLEQFMVVQGMIENQNQKIGELDNEILRLAEHENHVMSEIQEQGKVASDRMEKEIAEAQKSIEEIQERIQTIEFKGIHDEETHDMKVTVVKNQRNENISNAVEMGIKEIDIKLKKMDEAQRKLFKKNQSPRNVEVPLNHLTGIIKNNTMDQLSREETSPSSTSSPEIITVNNTAEEMDIEVQESNNDRVSNNVQEVKERDNFSDDMADSEGTASDSDDPFGTADTPVQSEDESTSLHQTSTTPKSQAEEKRFVMKTPSKDVGTTLNAPKDGTTRVSSETPGRQKRLLISNTPNNKSTVKSAMAITSRTPAKHSCIERELTQTTDVRKNFGENNLSKTPGGSRQKRLLNTKPIHGSKSSSIASLSNKSSSLGNAHQSPRSPRNAHQEAENRTLSNLSISRGDLGAINPTKPSSGRTKRTLNVPAKKDYLSGASSAEEDTLVSSSQTPGSRRDKRYLAKPATKATRD